MIASGWLFLRTRVSPVATLNVEDLYEDVTSLADRLYHTVNYIPVYAVGLMLGNILVKQRGQTRVLSTTVNTLCFAGVLANVLVAYLLYDDKKEFVFGREYEVLYAATGRTLGAVTIAGFFYALFNMRNPLILTWARSASITIVSRLSLSWFVTHSLFVVLTIATSENSGTSGRLLLSEMIWVLLVSFIPACLMFVFVEAPFGKLLTAFKNRSNDKVNKKE